MASSSSSAAIATCQHCGSRYRLYSIFRRPAGLVKAWKRKHERQCAKRTPAERRKWARQYVGRDGSDSALTVDLGHTGFQDAADDTRKQVKA